MSEGKNKIKEAYILLLGMLVVIVASLILVPLYQYVDFTTDEVEITEIVAVIEEEKPEIVGGIHLESGLKVDDGWEAVNTNCTRCHSAKIITNNKFTRQGWKDLIVWMQETQGLWQLGANEDIILDYLEKNYAPGEKKGRRTALKIEEDDWYILE